MLRTYSDHDRVREHQIDALLTRRLQLDAAFRTAFVGSVCAQVRHALACEAAIAVTQQRHVGSVGTIDVLAHIAGREEPSATLLIENKIDARFTPNQPERYLSSAAALTRPGCPAFAVLCAPRGYFSASRLASRFQARIALEDMYDWVDGTDMFILKAAIAQFEYPAESEPVPQVAEFFQGYDELVATYAPDLTVKRSPNSNGERPEGSYTIYFVTKQTLPRYPFLPTLRFSHQCQDKQFRPSVKVMFAGWTSSAARISPLASHDLEGTGFYLRLAGASLALVCDTPGMNNQRPVRDQFEAVLQGVRAAAKLRAWMYGNEEALRRWAAAAG